MTSNEITICGKVYYVKPISSSVSMEEVATLVNVKMKGLLEAKSKTSMVDVAVLTALNLGHELIELKQGKQSEGEQLNQHLDGMIQKLKKTLDDVEKKRVSSY
ncbi:MAG: cell division protein ZapA [Nitrospina sp.]|jgi:cell division protein ZapA (FtsZ GTPase activity inhibitor)|nr:cell division protein ZapA [Nitrospina sp.]MBT5986117.1 cell division protein ZapA [Nitrospina sp.]